MAGTTSESWQLLRYAEDVAEAPLETAGPWLAGLLERLASVPAAELDHAAIVRAMSELQRGEALDEGATIWSLDLHDQSEDVTQYVAPDLALRTLYTLLNRAREARTEQLTHDWIATTTAAAVRHYRGADAVNAQRGATLAHVNHQRATL